MHTVQILLLDVTDQDITDRAVLSRLVDANLGDMPESEAWFDWYQIGGRWEDYLTETIGPMIWPNQLDSPVALKLTKENWPMAIKLLDKAIEQQATEVLSYVNQLKETKVDLNDYILNLNPLPQDKETWLVPFYIHNIFKIKGGDWTCDSGFVDLTNWQSAKPQLLRDYLKDPANNKDLWNSEIENYALVVVDFHF